MRKIIFIFVVFSLVSYSKYFPTYCPNGDYYFFIDVNFHFGYLGHPWQQKVWIYGKN